MGAKPILLLRDNLMIDADETLNRIRILFAGRRTICGSPPTGSMEFGWVGHIGQAIEQAEKYDIVVADAGTQNSELCEQLRQRAGTSAFLVIFVVAADDVKMRMEAFAAGAIDCISADMPRDEIIARITSHANLARKHTRLQRENERYRLALDSIGQGVCLFDADEKLLLSNPRYAEVYGLDPEAIRPGQTLEEVLKLRYELGAFPDVTRDEYLDWAKSTNDRDCPQTWIRILRRGTVIRGYHQRTADGGWVATHEDITKAWKAEKELERAHLHAERAEKEARAAHARLLAAFEVVPEGLALFDAEDRYVLWNKRYEQLYAESGDEITRGMRFEDRLRAGLARGQYIDAIGREEQWLAERLERHAQPISTHEQHLPGDRWLRIDERRIPDGGSVGIRVDITDLKRREASFRLLFEHNPMPMWVYDWHAHQFLAVNKAALEHYGYSRQQFLSMTIRDVHVRDDEKHLRRASCFSGVHGRSPKRGWKHVRADGTVIDVNIYSSFLKYQDREASLIAAIDVTDRALAERALIEHRDHLEEAVRCRTAELAKQAQELEGMLERERQINELQRQFVSMVSHEFRTPLAVIDGAAQRLTRRKGQLNEEFVHEKASNIRSSVSRMLELMESILAAGRLDHGKIEIRRQPCSIKDVVAGCATRQGEVRPTHRFLLNLNELPATIVADSASLEQVFTNLFSNAVKYAPGRPEIEVIGWTEGDYACVSVRDQGIGIDTDDLPNMFQRYFRARSSSGIAGTGIGLNLVRQIVELHGGTISVASIRGQGTTFSVRLPTFDPVGDSIIPGAA